MPDLIFGGAFPATPNQEGTRKGAEAINQSHTTKKYLSANANLDFFASALVFWTEL